LFFWVRSLTKEKNRARFRKNEKSLLRVPRIARMSENLASLSRQFAASSNRRLQFHKRSQLFIRVHNEPLSVAAMRVRNPDRPPVGINR